MILCTLPSGTIKALSYYGYGPDRWSATECQVHTGRKKRFHPTFTSERGLARFEKRKARFVREYEEEPGRVVRFLMEQVNDLKKKFPDKDIYLSRVGSKTCPIKVDLRRDKNVGKWNRRFVMK